MSQFHVIPSSYNEIRSIITNAERVSRTPWNKRHLPLRNFLLSQRSRKYHRRYVDIYTLLLFYFHSDYLCCLTTGWLNLNWGNYFTCFHFGLFIKIYRIITCSFRVNPLSRVIHCYMANKDFNFTLHSIPFTKVHCFFSSSTLTSRTTSTSFSTFLTATPQPWRQ